MSWVIGARAENALLGRSHTIWQRAEGSQHGCVGTCKVDFSLKQAGMNSNCTCEQGSHPRAVSSGGGCEHC
jgi:hypothetical protein